MLKQKFCLLKAPKNNALFIFSCALIMLFGFVVILPAVPASTYAEGDNPEDGISIVASSDIKINLVSKNDGYYKIAKDTITVSTSAVNGYTLSLATDSPDHQALYLNGDTSSESRINGAAGTYEEPKALDGYEWGFAVPGISRFEDVQSTAEPSVDSKFAIIPLENKIIRDYTEATTENTTDIYYGFKLSGTLEPGEYETAITYTAVPADGALTAKAVLGNNGNLNFLYDRKTYTRGEIYEDNLGETKINAVYNVPINSSWDNNRPGWVENNSIKSVNFESPFYNFKPTSTSYWFYNDRYLSSITQAKNLNTSNVTDMSSMFSSAGYNAATWNIGDLNDWNTSNVTNMSDMFSLAGYYAATFNLDISGWDTNSVTHMSYMFSDAGGRSTTWNIGDLSSWNTGSVIDMQSMFADAGRMSTTWNIGDLSGWKTSSVVYMRSVFSGAGSEAGTWTLGDIGDWDTSSVINMAYMFNGAGYRATTWNIGNLGGWDTGSVTDMDSMFSYAGYNATTFNLNLSGWNTGNVINMSSMFENTGRSATTWNIGDLSSWDTSNVKGMSYMFYFAGYNATTWDIRNLKYAGGEHKGWNVSKVTNHSSFVNWDQANIDTSKLPWQSN